MELKLFGKSIFEFNKKDKLNYFVSESLKDTKYLPDFYDSNGLRNVTEKVIIQNDANGELVAVPAKDKAQEDEMTLTPKGVYELKLLNQKGFKIKTDEEYVDEQIKQFTEKLDIVTLSEKDISRGVKEISSILIRLKNRKKYGKFEHFYSEYAYTVTTKIKDVIDKHSYLRFGRVEQFVADLPKEAIDEMKKYTDNTKELCDKKPIFYIIADKKDFGKTEGRKDPILLAQSPFGHFWQIIGAWDKEMLFLEEL